MKLAILGGGGFRTPLVYRALLGDQHSRRIDTVALHDVDAGRLAAIANVLRHQAAGSPSAPRIYATTRLDEAIEGADFVFSAIRVGGLEGRTADERVALDLGLLGQETTGPGGLAYGLRTVPVAMEIAEQVSYAAPDAWVISFTNPAGMVTEAMKRVLGDRVIGICDSPLGLARRAARHLGVGLDSLQIEYAGLNHLGWLTGLVHEGSDILPRLVADSHALEAMEEGQLFGADWIQSLGCIPNEYLHYWYFTREAIASIRGSAQTRGEFLLGQQQAFYEAVAASPERSLAEWDRVRLERNATYMDDARRGKARDDEDVDSGGYEGVALALMAALARDEPATLILNVRNGFRASRADPGGVSGAESERLAIPGLPAEAVVEVPCRVDASGPRPTGTAGLAGHQLGLIQQVKAVEQLAIEAAVTGSESLATQAFSLHPLVDSVTVARQLLTAYRLRIPTLDAVFHR